ncbi:MAG: WD40 repeat domain-containing protein, partial [Stackebrandtia sp.]
DWDDYVRFKTEVALVMAANGNPRAGARLHREAANDASHGVGESALPFVASALGATFAVLGRPELGEEWIQRAIIAIDANPNPWEHRMAVCWALLEGGLEDRARQLWTEGEDGEPADSNGWLAHLIRIGREDLMREFLYDVGEDWYSFRDAVAVFTAAGRGDLMREFFEYYGHTPDDEDIESLAEADRNAVTPRPNEFDIAELRRRRADLLRSPSSERRVDTIRLAWRAAACHHYDAVLDMLKLLPYKDYDDRPETAVRSLWTAETGIDDDPW